MAPPLLAPHTKKERKAHIEFYWLMFCIREESERQQTGHRQSDKLQLCSLSVIALGVFGVRTIWVIARHWQLVCSGRGQKHVRIDRNLERKSPCYHAQASVEFYLTGMDENFGFSPGFVVWG